MQWRRPIRPVKDGRNGLRLPEPFRDGVLGSLVYPLSLPWESLWRASWTLPWLGEETTGPSLGRDLYEAVNFPGSGTPQNGYTPAAFDGVNDLLVASGAAEDYFGVTAWTIHAVVKCNSLAAPGGFTADNEALLSIGPGSSAVALAFDSDGVTALQYDGVGGTAETTRIAVGTTDYRRIQARWTGTLLECRVDGGAWQSVACTSQVAYSGTGEVLRVGVNYDGTKFLDCDLLELGVFAQALSDAELDALDAYADLRYDLTAGGPSLISGTASLSLSAAGTVIGRTALSGSAPLSLTATGTLTGRVGISGTATLSLTAAGTIRGRGDLSGSTSLSLLGAGSLSGRGILSGSATLSLTATGEVIDGGFVDPVVIATAYTTAQTRVGVETTVACATEQTVAGDLLRRVNSLGCTVATAATVGACATAARTAA